MKRTFFFVGMMILVATGCGGPIEPEMMAEQPQSEGDVIAPPGTTEGAEEDREVNALACNLHSYMNTYSCHQTCNLTGARCANGTQQWSCFAINFEHWKTSTGADQFRARGWENAWVTKCQNTHPANCPGFCG